MRTGAIFARGSCRALKWMAMFGVVFALGAGSAAAQLTPDATYDTDGFKVEGLGKTIMEGEGATVKVSLRARVAPGTADMTTVNVTVSVAAPAAETPPDPTDNYETSDVALNNATVQLVFSANPEPGADQKLETKSASVFLQTTNDVDAEREDFAVQIQVGGGGTSISQEDLQVTIVDDEPQTYVLSEITKEPTEGSPISATVTATPAHVNMSADLRVHVDDADYAIDADGNAANGMSSGMTLGLFGGNLTNSQTLSIATPTNDENRVEDTITLSVFSGTAGASELEDSAAIKVKDAHALPAVAGTAIVLGDDDKPLDPQPEMVDSIMEGQTIQVKVAAVNKDGEEIPAAEELSVMLMPTGDANEQDYRLSRHPVVIDGGDKSMTIELTASEDQDVGMEMLMFDAVVTGKGMTDGKSHGDEPRTSMGVLDLAIMDTTMKQVEAKTEAELMPIIYGAIDEGEGDDGVFSPYETIEIDASMLFMPTDYMLSYGAESDMMDVASVETSGSMVTVTGKMAGGPTHITITATSTGMMSGAKPLDQTSPNVAQVIFPVTVELAELMVELSMDDDMMNITEGMGAMVTATANRPVEMDTMVELIQTEGTASPSDYMAEPLMIMAGETMGTTMVMAVEDEMMEEGETLTLEGRVGEMKTNAVMFYIWDAAVPALPLIAQLLLAAFLTIGGYRRYLRR